MEAETVLELQTHPDMGKGRAETMGRLTKEQLAELRKMDDLFPYEQDFIDTIDALESELAALQFQFEGMREGRDKLQIERDSTVQEIASLTEKMPCGHPKACWVETIRIPANNSLPSAACTACADQDARVRLEVAAALRKAAEIHPPFVIPDEFGPTKYDEAEHKRRIHALIPAADTSLLAEHDEAQHAAGANWMLDSIRDSLHGYPDQGGDIEVMREIERIAQEKVARARLEEAEAWILILGGFLGSP